MRGLSLAFTLAVLTMTAAPERAGARPSDDRPWGRGVLVPSLGFGASISPPVSTVSFGLGASYFVANGLGIGLGVSDTVLIFSRSFRATYPGVEDQVATNIVRVMPTLQYVFWRGYRFAPYVFGGAGPVFLNNGGGMVGEWTAGPGAFIRIGGPIFLDLGVGFSARFSKEKCDAAFTYDGPTASGQIIDACSFRWGPRIGLVIAFGGRRAPPQRQPAAAPPPSRAWEEPASPPPGPPQPVPIEAEPDPAPETEPELTPLPEPLPESQPAPAPGPVPPAD